MATRIVKQNLKAPTTHVIMNKIGATKAHEIAASAAPVVNVPRTILHLGMQPKPAPVPAAKTIALRMQQPGAPVTAADAAAGGSASSALPGALGGTPTSSYGDPATDVPTTPQPQFIDPGTPLPDEAGQEPSGAVETVMAMSLGEKVAIAGGALLLGAGLIKMLRTKR
jgi:hypothetical protein